MKTKVHTKAGLWAGLIAASLFSGLPVLWLLSSSFKSNVNIFAHPPKLIDGSFSLGAYISVLGDPEKVRFFLIHTALPLW